mmetsp:Transcript_59260/g.125598  ORF Transcript_59260/g.125598 Transcript_59260/m.125598 type:complete len:80 (+) Transcript_59260:823-1062(+)
MLASGSCVGDCLPVAPALGVTLVAENLLTWGCPRTERGATRPAATLSGDLSLAENDAVADGDIMEEYVGTSCPGRKIGI